MSETPAVLDYIFSTNQLKVLSFLAKLSDKEFHEREIARQTGISYGSANRVLNELFADEILVRHRVGRMLFYSFNSRDPICKTLKIFVSVSMLRPLIKKLREWASEIVMYGSCARGEDSSASDMDLFVVSAEKEKVLGIIEKYRFRKGYKGIKIQPVILSAIDLLRSEKSDKEFLSLVKEGIVLWDEMKDEAGIQGMSESGQDRSFSARGKTRR